MDEQPKPQKAHELLSDESKWARGSYAKNDLGRSVTWNSARAICWCARGAIRYVYPSTYGSHELRLAHVLGGEQADGSEIAHWNDEPSRTFAEVHDLLLRLDI